MWLEAEQSCWDLRAAGGLGLTRFSAAAAAVVLQVEADPGLPACLPPARLPLVRGRVCGCVPHLGRSVANLLGVNRLLRPRSLLRLRFGAHLFLLLSLRGSFWISSGCLQTVWVCRQLINGKYATWRRIRAADVAWCTQLVKTCPHRSRRGFVFVPRQQRFRSTSDAF